MERTKAGNLVFVFFSPHVVLFTLNTQIAKCRSPQQGQRACFFSVGEKTMIFVVEGFPEDHSHMNVITTDECQP